MRTSVKHNKTILNISGYLTCPNDFFIYYNAFSYNRPSRINKQDHPQKSGFCSLVIQKLKVA